MSLDSAPLENKLKLYDKEQKQIISANHILHEENRELEKKIKFLEEKVHYLEKVIEDSKSILEDRNRIIEAFESTSDFFSHEKQELLKTLNAYQTMNEMSQTELKEAHSVIKVHEEVERLSWEERRSVDSELLLAQKIQFGIMSRKLPEIPGLEIVSHYNPVHKLGGDLYSVNHLKDGRLAVFMADVAGHGTQAALITMIVKTLIENLFEQDKDAGTLLYQLNNDLYKIIKELKMFITATVLFVDLSTMQITYGNGGHPPFLLRRKTVAQMDAAGALLGAFDNMKYETGKVAINKGDMIVVYTDGIIEALNDKTEEFSVEKLIESFENGGESALSASNKILGDLDLFCGNRKKDDDISMITMKIV